MTSLKSTVRSVASLAVLWPLLSGSLAAQEPIVLKGHQEVVYDAEFLPDSNSIVTASFDRTLKLWDLKSQTAVRTMEGHTGIVLTVAVSPVGTLIASGAADNTVKLWDVPKSDPVSILQAHDAAGTAIDVSSDGKRIATADESGVVRILDGESGEKLFEVKLASGVNRLHWRRDGAQLAAGTRDGSLVLISGADGTIAGVIGAHSGEVTGVAFSTNNSQLFTSGADGIVRRWPTTIPTVVEASGHAGVINAIAQHPNGSLIATAGQDGTARVFNRADGKELRQLAGHGGPVTAIAFSANGAQIATACADKIARLFDANSGSVVKEFPALGDALTAIALAPNAQYLIAGDNAGSVKTFKIADAVEQSSFTSPGGPVRGLAVWSDSSRIVAASGKTVATWNLADGAAIKTLNADADVTAIALASNNSLVAIGQASGVIVLANPETGDGVAALTGHNKAVNAIEFNTNQTQLVSASADGTARLWDVKLAAPLQHFSGHSGTVSGISFQRDNRSVVTAGADGKLRIDSISNQAQHVADEVRVNDLAIASNGAQYATAGADGSVKLWNAGNGAPIRSVSGFEGPVLCVSLSPNNQQIAAGGQDGTLRTWNAGNGSPYFRFVAGAEVQRVQFSPDSAKLIAALGNQTLQSFDPTPLNPQPADPPGREAAQTLKGHSGAINGIGWSPDSQTLRTISADQKLVTWSVAAASFVASLTGHSSQVYSVAFSPDGRQLVSASNDKTVRLWDVEGRKAIRTLTTQQAAVYSVAFSPDGSQLAIAGADNSVRLFRSENGTEIRVFNGPEHAVYAVAFSPDGKRLAAGGMGVGAERPVFVWDVGNSDPAQKLPGHTDDVYRVQFTPSGNRILSVGYAGHVKVRDAGSNETVFETSVGTVTYSGRISPDGTRLAIAAGDRTLLVVPLPESVR